jgi:RNA polymerase sigma factor (TIGR02999 family)
MLKELPHEGVTFMRSISKPATNNGFDSSGRPGEVTAWLRRLPRGDSDAMSRVMKALYGDLKRIAVCRMRGERPDHTLDPDALISELFLQLAKNPSHHFENRAHFLAFASQQMRRFLVDYARAHRSEKRYGRRKKVGIEECGVMLRQDLDQLLIVDQLIETLAAQEPRMAKVVEMRCFGGLTHSEIASALGMDERTAKRDWSFARAWLECELRKGVSHGLDG